MIRQVLIEMILYQIVLIECKIKLKIYKYQVNFGNMMEFRYGMLNIILYRIVLLMLRRIVGRGVWISLSCILRNLRLYLPCQYYQDYRSISHQQINYNVSSHTCNNSGKNTPHYLPSANPSSNTTISHTFLYKIKNNKI